MQSLAAVRIIRSAIAIEYHWSKNWVFGEPPLLVEKLAYFPSLLRINHKLLNALCHCFNISMRHHRRWREQSSNLQVYIFENVCFKNKCIAYDDVSRRLTCIASLLSQTLDALTTRPSPTCDLHLLLDLIILRQYQTENKEVYAS